MRPEDSSLKNRTIPEPTAAVQPTRRRRLATILKVIELRLRFVVLMAVTGLVFASWDSILNHVEKWLRPSEGQRAASPSSAGVESYCPMHPSVVSEEPGQCPICGMQLARRKRAGNGTVPAGVLSQVRLAPGQIAQAGIRTVAVSFARPTDLLTTVGIVEYDESRRVEVAAEGRGRARIERLYVQSEGERVRAGQRLAELYSYDIAQSIRLLVEASSAMHSSTPNKPDALATPLGDPGERVRLATQALEVLGVRQDQIDAITSDESPTGRLPVLAPIGGLLIKKTACQGQYVPEGTLLFEIADLSHVWVDAQVFEDQLALVCVGQRVAATVAAFPGEEFRGKVEQLAPALDPETHTLAVRFSLDNPRDRLRPGMLATVAFSVSRKLTIAASDALCPVSRIRLGTMGPAIAVEVQGRRVSVCCKACVAKLKAAPEQYLDHGPGDTATPDRVLSVPESAVVDTGSKKIVYVEASPGIFEGRAVLLGPRSGDSFPVLGGLAPGEKVAAAGAVSDRRRKPAQPSDAGPGRYFPGADSSGSGGGDSACADYVVTRIVTGISYVRYRSHRAELNRSSHSRLDDGAPSAAMIVSTLAIRSRRPRDERNNQPLQFCP